jgi:hypothetical protein
VLAACAAQGDPRVMCSQSLDHAGEDPTWFRLVERFQTARANHDVLTFHGHEPGEGVQVSTIANVIELARRNDLPMLRYDEIATATRGGVALAIDDDAIDEWFALRDLFTQTGTHVTFFVTRWAYKPPEQIDKLLTLAADGHELEPHTVDHLHPIAYVRDHGIDAWIAEQVDPSIQIMRDAGFEPQFLAYPFGERDDEIDRAALERIQAVRATGHYCVR